MTSTGSTCVLPQVWKPCPVPTTVTVRCVTFPAPESSISSNVPEVGSPVATPTGVTTTSSVLVGQRPVSRVTLGASTAPATSPSTPRTLT